MAVDLLARRARVLLWSQIFPYADVAENEQILIFDPASDIFPSKIVNNLIYSYVKRHRNISYPAVKRYIRNLKEYDELKELLPAYLKRRSRNPRGDYETEIKQVVNSILEKSLFMND